MIEMRWVIRGGDRQLQYRRQLQNLSSDGLTWHWSDWMRVPEVEHEERGYGSDAQWIG